MPTYDERLGVLEQTTASLRAELSQVLHKIKQLEQHDSDSNHQQTMLLSLAYGQEHSIRAIQEDVRIMKERMEQRFNTVDQRFNTVDQRFNAVEGRLERLETKFDEHTSLLTQILSRLPEKS